MEKLKGYKTFLWAAWPNIAILLALAGFDTQTIQDFVVNNWELAVVAYTAGVALLRSVTNSAPAILGLLKRGKS